MTRFDPKLLLCLLLLLACYDAPDPLCPGEPPLDPVDPVDTVDTSTRTADTGCNVELPPAPRKAAMAFTQYSIDWYDTGACHIYGPLGPDRPDGLAYSGLTLDDCYHAAPEVVDDAMETDAIQRWLDLVRSL